MIHSRLFKLAFLILLVSPVEAWAQHDGRLAAVEGVRPGRQLRVDVLRLGRLHGRLVAADSTTLTLARGQSTIAVPLSEVDRLWVRDRATGKGALIGAGVGVAAGIVGGFLIGSIACEPVDGDDCTALGVAATAGFLGGAGGAALGAGIGLAIPIWRLRFP